MADFVAVIRRTVDGLANNTPEMRLRVYDKARGAVQRQLENMKPRPSDEMLRRQMDKLEAAITSVEAEHAEALPSLEPDVAPGAAPVFAPEVAEPYREPEQAPLPDPRTAQPDVAPEVAQTADDAASSYGASAYEQQAEPEDDFRAAEPVSPRVVDDRRIEPTYDDAAHDPFAADVDHSPRPSFGAWDENGRDQGASAAHADDARMHAFGGAPARDLPQDDDADRLVPMPAPTVDRSYDDGAADQGLWPQDPDAPERVTREGAAFDYGRDHDTVGRDDFGRDNFGQRDSGERDRDDRFASAENGDALRAEPPLGGPMGAYDLLDSHSPQAGGHVADVPPEAGWSWPDDNRSQPQAASDEPPMAVPAWTDAVELPRAGNAPSPASSLGGPFDDRHAVEAFDAHFEQPVTSQATARMPSVSDLPDYHAAPASQVGQAADDSDPFVGFSHGTAAAAQTSTGQTAGQTATGQAAGADLPAAGQAGQAEPDPWNDLEELIGYNKAAASAAARAPAGEDDLHDDMMPPPVRPYRAAPKKKRSFAPLLLALLGLVIVGGGGYVAWSKWDTLGDMVGGVFGSSTTETAQQTPAAETPAAQTANQTPANQTPASQAPADQAPAAGQTQAPAANGQAAAPAAGQANGAPASDGTTSGQKFTQRLLANGSEVDEGAGGPAATGSNQSVAQLNSPPGTAAATPPTAAAQAPAAAAAGTTPAVNPADTAAVQGEKMFLYEERLGQTAPTAVEGTVSWSLQREKDDRGRDEPTVQARINVPGRGLTALVTFKRNSDASLPASHLIELVFSVPPDFEGGAIDSVQRIAMKDTEQDRGTPLVAVPAKITDDFHMIALNDFPDARATNLELLRTKNWLDIPLAYRNGRRALLTLQKGPEGGRAFDTAIREWSALSPATGQ